MTDRAKPPDGLGRAARELGAADYRRGIAENPFRTSELQAGWQAAWFAQQQVESEDAI